MEKAFSRIQRIESLMQAELAKLIQLKLKDPRLNFVTITFVKVSRDLSEAKVYVTLHDETNVKETIKILNRAAKFLRHELLDLMDLRKMPNLRFYYDESISRGCHISRLLSNIDDKT